MDRRLSAILAADIVGYSAQMERDEAGTFARLAERRSDVFEPEIARHSGRIFKTMGDGILAEFGGVVQAVECAVLLQTALEERNLDVPDDQAIRARIGINLGDVIVDGDDRYGEGVNIAARLEQLAEPGGICVFDKVVREARNRVSVHFDFVGERKVKNISSPQHVYRVVSTKAAQRRRILPIRWVVASVVLISIVMASWFGLGLARPSSEWAPTLAVMPFSNHSGDPRFDYLETALPEQISSTFSTTPLLRVLPALVELSGASASDRSKVAVELGAKYMLSGSIRTDGQNHVVSIQLVDGTTGVNVWTESYTHYGNDLVAMQRSIAQQAYATYAEMTGIIVEIEVSAAWERPLDMLDEFGIHRRGLAAMLGFTDGGVDQAIGIWQEGLERFPRSALLRLEMARELYVKVTYGHSTAPWEDVQVAWAMLEKVRELPVGSRFEDWLRHYVRALLLPLAKADFAEAMREAAVASRIMPSDPTIHMDLALVAAYSGNTAQAVKWAEFGFFSLDEQPIESWVLLGKVYLLNGRTEAAALIFDEFWDKCPSCAAVAWVRAGRQEEARELVEAGREVLPEWSVAMERVKPTGQNAVMVADLLDPYLADLRTAGLP
jgi:class 3 adenylate cyclase/TolB-like protein